MKTSRRFLPGVIPSTGRSRALDLPIFSLGDTLHLAKVRRKCGMPGITCWDYTCRKTSTPANGSHSWAVSAGPLTLSRMTSTAVVRILTRQILLPGCTAQSSTMHRQASSSPGTRFRGTEPSRGPGRIAAYGTSRPRLGLAWDPTGSGLWSVRSILRHFLRGSGNGIF